MLPKVRFTADHHQLDLVIQVIDGFLEEEPFGETICLIHSILEQLVVCLRRRLAVRRHDYRLELPVHQALAFRRIVMAGQELVATERVIDLQMLISELDPKLTRYIHVA